MIDDQEHLPLDTRLLSEAIYELNISRHNVSVYPEDHPIVEKSLDQAFGNFQKLFDLRAAFTLSIAKDTIIIEKHYLDKQNSFFRDFAVCLSQKDIAYVNFKRGLTKDELYSFQRFLVSETTEASQENKQSRLNEYKLIHIDIGFIDYTAFSLNEGGTEEKDSTVSLWEQYIYGLMVGNIQYQDVSNVTQEIPPVRMAELINSISKDQTGEGNYNNVISSYIGKSATQALSDRDFKKLVEVINTLRPEIKRQFLSSTMDIISDDIDSVQKVLQNMPLNDILDFLSIVNEQMLVIPEALNNVLTKFSKLNHGMVDAPSFNGELIEDDILLSNDVTGLLSDSNFNAFVSDIYQKEIHDLIQHNSGNISSELIEEYEKQWSDEYIENIFNDIIIELMSPDRPGIITEEEYNDFLAILKEQIEQFINTGQYKLVLKTLMTLEANVLSNPESELKSSAVKFYHEPEFIDQLVYSIRLMGREMKEDTYMLCEYYKEEILPFLIDALVDELSPSIRRFLLALITRFGDFAASIAITRLNDKRWFVIRNMLFILLECGNDDSLYKAKQFCNHENPKVSFEAMKCLFKAGYKSAADPLRNYLKSGSREYVNKALLLAGTYKVKEVVPDLIKMLNKKSLTGSNIEDKVSVVRTLGHIKDPRALEALKSVLSTKNFLFSESLEKLKKETRIALKHYANNKNGGTSCDESLDESA